MAEISIDLQKISTAMDEAAKARLGKEPARPYFGISGAGHECDRFLWLSFRWAGREEIDGRMLRLFRRGHREEETIVEDLRAAGVVLSHVLDDQYEVAISGWVKGHLDGIAESGVPGAERTRHVVEMKTHNDKSFRELTKKGVQEAKPMHYAQMQLYMLGTGTDRALYVAVNKNDDTYYTERVKYDAEFANKLARKCESLAEEDRMPEPLSDDPDHFVCRYCRFHDLCHGSRLCREVNCRTCAHFTATPEGKAMCSRWDQEVPTEGQYEGCACHVMHPDLTPWRLNLMESTTYTAAYEIGGRTYLNGDGGYTTKQLLEVASCTN